MKRYLESGSHEERLEEMSDLVMSLMKLLGLGILVGGGSLDSDGVVLRLLHAAAVPSRPSLLPQTGISGLVQPRHPRRYLSPGPACNCNPSYLKDGFWYRRNAPARGDYGF